MQLCIHIYEKSGGWLALSSPRKLSDMPVNFLTADLGASLGASAAISHLPHLFCHSQLSATFTIPIWQWFLTRFGKKTAVYVGISVSGAQGVEFGFG